MVNKFRLPPEFNKFNPNVVEEILLPNGIAKVLYGVFSKQECKWLIQHFENSNYHHVKDAGYSPLYRDNYRSIQDSYDLASVMYDRITGFIDNRIQIDHKNRQLSYDGLTNRRQYDGLWEKDGLNYRFRLCKYIPGGHFNAHSDSDYVESENRKSFKTCMLYLNDDYDRGETIFIDNNISIKPKPGMILLFNHLLYHKGATVINGNKYIARTEVMYKKIVPEMTVNSNKIIDNEAHKLIMHAERLEADGKPHEAIEFYKKAYKLDPSLDIF